MGYEARTTLEISIRDVAALGRVLDAALAVGATEISNITFVSDTAAAAKRQALRVALAMAKDEAQALAAAAGGRLGALKSMSTSPDNNASAFARMAYESSSGYGAASPRGMVPAVQRDVVVSASVYARWVFVSAP
jgi:uncharacterized protein YggE